MSRRGSTRRAEQRSASGLDLWPVHIPLTDYQPSSACFRRFASEPLARLLRFIAAAPPPGRIQPDVNAPMKRRMRPIRRVRHETVLGWVEMREVHMSRAVAIIADRVLPVPPLPNAAFATAGHDR
jgi:hypothetical protein